jgi:hypothetical protein
MAGVPLDQLGDAIRIVCRHIMIRAWNERTPDLSHSLGAKTFNEGW